MKNVGESHDLYVQSDALVDLFDNLKNMSIKIYKIDPENFCSALRLAWKAALKKTKVKLDLLTGIDILLMVEKHIRGGICHFID